MKLRSLLTLHAVVAVFFGVPFVLAPAQSLMLYGVAADPAHQLLARLLGAAFIGYAIITWNLRDCTDPLTLRSFSIAILVSFAIATVGATYAVLTGATNALGWSTVFIYSAFALAYLSVLTAGKETASSYGR